MYLQVGDSTEAASFFLSATEKTTGTTQFLASYAAVVESRRFCRSGFFGKTNIKKMVYAAEIIKNESSDLGF